MQTVACIGGIVSGMTDTGVYREYFKTEMSSFVVSSELSDLFSQFESVVAEFTEIDSTPLREELAFEVVESAARFHNSMLLERSIGRSKVERRAHRKQLTESYILDSKAILEANLTRIRGKKKSLQLV